MVTHLLGFLFIMFQHCTSSPTIQRGTWAESPRALVSRGAGLDPGRIEDTPPVLDCMYSYTNKYDGFTASLLFGSLGSKSDLYNWPFCFGKREPPDVIVLLRVQVALNRHICTNR